VPRKPRSASPTSEQECVFSDSDGFMTSGGTSHPSFVCALACLLQEKLTGVYGACAQHHMVPSVMISMYDERSELRFNTSRAITQESIHSFLALKKFEIL